MRIKIAALMCGALGLPYVVFGQQHPTPPATAEQSITGDWVIHFQAGHESVSGNLHLQADGERLSGTVETAHTGPGTIQNGKWSNQKLDATLTFEKHESVVLKGELKSNATLVGTYTTEGRTETWQAERKTAAASNSTSGVYEQYEALIGTWDVTAPEGGPSFAVQRFTWGPGHSYIWYAGSFIGHGGKEEPHFEGMLVWNGVHKNLDMLLTMDPKSGRAQEQGTFNVTPDGTFVREITGVFSEGVTPIGEAKVGPDGMSEHFRQTYKPHGMDELLTAVMRETNDGSWVATFPGSEKLVMKRRKAKG
ncbi:MAG TPA: hypothetical protein VGI60_09950 [Chthoniobacterales bacterium]